MEPLPNFRQKLVEFSLAFPGSGFVAAVAATGLITCVSNANMADSDYLTIGDGMNPAVLYEYDKSANGVTSGRVAWTAGAGTAAQSAATLKTAIDANQPGLLVTDNADGTLTITHRWPGTGGNVTITENVANAGFLVAGLSGGLAAVATSITADTTLTIFKALGSLELVKAEVISPVGLVQDAANYFIISVKNLTAGVTMATWSTLTGAQGSLTANTFKTMVLSAVDGALRAAPADVIALDLDVHGSQTLPPGRVVLHCRYRGGVGA